MIRDARNACAVPDEPYVVAQELASEAMRARILADDALFLRLLQWRGMMLRDDADALAARRARASSQRADQP